MSRILFVWELGLGFGHLVPYSPLVKKLREQGHQVIFAARDVANAERVFGNSAVSVLQAPIFLHKISNRYRTQYSYAHLMHNLGFGDARSLFSLAKAWRHVFQYVQPDLAIFDHSPIALLAAKSHPCKRIISGSGFLVPPPGEPLPMMRYWQNYDQERLRKEENNVLANANRVLDAFGVGTMDRLADLFAADEQFLLSFKELDHYPMRANGNYLGMFPMPGHGVAPAWPAGTARKVYAYLHGHRSTEALLSVLAEGNFGTIIYAPDLPAALVNKYRSGKMRFSPQPLDLDQVAAACDIAITNATFATTTAFLLHGVPVLVIPTNLERFMLARRLGELGVGTVAMASKPAELKPAIRALFTADRYRAAARAFAARYAQTDLDWQTDQMAATIGRLCTATAPATARKRAKTTRKKPARRKKKTAKKTPAKTATAKKKRAGKKKTAKKS